MTLGPMSDGSSPQCAAGSAHVIQFPLEGGRQVPGVGGGEPLSTNMLESCFIFYSYRYSLMKLTFDSDVTEQAFASGPAADVDLYC